MECKSDKASKGYFDVRHFNKKKELPDPSDIEKLAAYLVREIKKLDMTISNSSEILFRGQLYLLRQGYFCTIEGDQES